MAFMKWSDALRGSLTGLVAVASTAAFGAEAEGVVRIRSKDSQPAGVVIRGQSPSDCVPMIRTTSAAKTDSGAPVAALIPPKESPAPEPRVTQIGGEEADKASALEAPGALPLKGVTGEYAGLFSSESAAPFNRPMQFAEATPQASAEVETPAEPGAASTNSGAEGVASVGSCPPGNGCPPVYYDACPPGYHCGTRHVLCNNCVADKLRCHAMNHRMRNRQTSAVLCGMLHDECEEKFEWFRCKFGYFFPSGSGGKGSALVGHYSMVYPVNPQYQDPRDCQVYSAQGYYGPVAVPLAPVVNHTYNYGWGVPSSRLTPVSHPIATPYGYGY
jgi:hypothetical protein